MEKEGEEHEPEEPETCKKTPDSVEQQSLEKPAPTTTSASQLVKEPGSSGTLVLDDGHDVIFTVTIALAVPTVPDDQSDLKDALTKRVLDAPRAQNYYHLEYCLLPEDEPVRVDVVTYGLACKIYMERYEARVVKTWQEGDITWLAWAHSQVVTVTRELLVKMFNHTMELRLWDIKDKCSSRARFDRPRAFRLPQPRPGEKPEDIGGVKVLVSKVLNTFISKQPKNGSLVRPLPSQRKKTDGAVASFAQAAVGTKTSLEFPVGLSDAEHLDDTLFTKGKKPSQPVKGKPEKAKGKEDKDLKKQASDTSRGVSESLRKFGICMVPLRMALLFGDMTTEVSRLDSSVPGIEDVFLEVSLSSPLLSSAQKEDLNPLVIQICSASRLPASPIPYADLKQKCLPVYCKYKFFKEPDYVTTAKEHDKKIYWNDTNVLLLGTMEASLVREYLNGPGMEIEVHDRDRKPDLVTVKPKLFGEDLEDEKISNVGTVESRRTLYNPFHEKDKLWDPYGVARVDFSELFLGQRFLEMSIPILNCPIPDILGTTNSAGKLVGVAGAVDGPVECPLSAGHYIQESSMLKVRISVARPLVTPAELAANNYIQTNIECPFNRIIFIFDYHNVELLNNLQTVIMGLNARALSLDAMPQHVIDAALSAFKLSIVQQCSLELDIVTGFHVLDGRFHIFVLEGLRDKAITVLWETLPQPEQSDVRVLYNSDLSFSRRLYGPLDVDLCRVKLHEPLSEIVRQPLLYVRDMVFVPCYDAIIKLHQMTKVDKMRNVVKNDLFPTVEMIVTLSREFGVPLTQQDLEELQPTVSEESLDQNAPKIEPEDSYGSAAVENFSHANEEQLRKSKKIKNYIQANIKQVHALSETSHAERERNKKPYIMLDADPVYIYSIQHLNSMELAKEKLRQHLRQQSPTARYTYNQEFMSAAFCPVNIDQENKELEAASHARWMTNTGWTNPGRKTTRETAAHPGRPDSARVDELREEWTENFLHANITKPPLDRDRYPWCDRKKDFDLYAPPPSNFGNEDLLSRRVSGVQKAEDQNVNRIKQVEDWRSRVVVNDVRQYFHRVLPATEMTMKGFYSSNQLDRLKGLLKDPVRKYGLTLPGSSTNDIPALAAVIGPYVDTSFNCDQDYVDRGIRKSAGGKFCGLKPGDLYLSWTNRKNQIPCYNYQHEKFKKLKGQDFNAHYRSRNRLNIRPILPLRPEERDNHLFRVSFSAGPYSRPLPPVIQEPPSLPALADPSSQQNQRSDEKTEAEPMEETMLGRSMQTN